MDSIERNINTESWYHWGITINIYFSGVFCSFHLMMLQM